MDSISGGAVAADSRPAVAAEMRASHLPAWYLEMKKSLQASKDNHAVVCSHIAELQGKTKSLSQKITDVEAASEAGTVATEAICAYANNRTARRSALTRIPSDVLGCVFRFLSTFEIVRLGAVSKEIKALCADNMFWKTEFQTRCPHLIQTTGHSIDQCRRAIVSHAQTTRDCIMFVKLMKAQRSTVKHSIAAPRRSVSHPLPHLDRQDSVDDTGSGLVMSHSDTFSSEMNFMLLNALNTMLRITSHERDPIHSLLHADGAVTVLVSLLSNQAGQVQELSCGILANLLVWEARRNHYDKISTAGATCKSVAKQLIVCDGRNKLHALLTSPSASVNLAGHGERSIRLNGTAELCTRSAVQGMSCRSASRALICLFHPDDPVPSAERPTFHTTVLTSQKGYDEQIAHDTTIAKATTRSKNSRRPARKREDTIKSLSAKSGCPIRSNAVITEATIENIERSDDATVMSLEKLLSTKENCLAVPLNFKCTISQSWDFAYYFKSGSLSELISAQIIFSPHSIMFGRGVDSMGPFTLSGSAIMDIGGITWLINKMYARDSEINTDEWVSVPFTINDMAAELAEGGALSTRRAHISHTAHWSSCIDDARADSLTVDSSTRGLYLTRSGETEEKISWGLGLWGVWETSSGGSHYELQNGGVFRAKPKD